MGRSVLNTADSASVRNTIKYVCVGQSVEVFREEFAYLLVEAWINVCLFLEQWEPPPPPPLRRSCEVSHAAPHTKENKTSHIFWSDVVRSVLSMDVPTQSFIIPDTFIHCLEIGMKSNLWPHRLRKLQKHHLLFSASLSITSPVMRNKCWHRTFLQTSEKVASSFCRHEKFRYWTCRLVTCSSTLFNVLLPSSWYL